MGAHGDRRGRGPTQVSDVFSPAGPLTPRARPRRRGLPILASTLRESRALIGAACFYIILIGLLIGLIFPALRAVDRGSYVSNGTVGSLLGISKLTTSTFA